SRGQSVVVLHHDGVEKAVTRKATPAESRREAVDRGLVYVATTLVDAGIPVLIDAPDGPGSWGDLARSLIPSLAEVRLDEGEEVRNGEARGGEARDAQSPDLVVDPARQDVGEASSAIVDLVQRRFLHARGPLLSSRTLGDETSRRQVLLKDSD